MLKVFLSFPMKGRTNEQIAYSISQLSILARVLYGDDIEIVDNFCDVEPVEGADIHMLRIAEAIRKLAYCDVILYPVEYWDYRGCKVEVTTWEAYKGNNPAYKVKYNVGYIMDADEIKAKYSILN